MILIKIKKTHKTNKNTLTRNWILIKRNYEKLWFSGKEYEYLYYNRGEIKQHTSNSSNSVEKYKQKTRRKKLLLVFSWKTHYFIKQQQML